MLRHMRIAGDQKSLQHWGAGTPGPDAESRGNHMEASAVSNNLRHKSILGAACVAAAVAAVAWSPPALATLITASPSAAGLPAPGAPFPAPDFSFSGIRMSDFSTINIINTGIGTF